jgi:hypothetical protein
MKSILVIFAVFFGSTFSIAQNVGFAGEIARVKSNCEYYLNTSEKGDTLPLEVEYLKIVGGYQQVQSRVDQIIMQLCAHMARKNGVSPYKLIDLKLVAENPGAIVVFTGRNEALNGIIKLLNEVYSLEGELKKLFDNHYASILARKKILEERKKQLLAKDSIGSDTLLIGRALIPDWITSSTPTDIAGFGLDVISYISEVKHQKVEGVVAILDKLRLAPVKKEEKEEK